MHIFKVWNILRLWIAKAILKKKFEASDLQSKMTLQNYGIKIVCATNIKVYLYTMEQVTKSRY